MKREYKKGIAYEKLPFYLFLLIMTLGSVLWTNNYLGRQQKLSVETEILTVYSQELIESELKARIDLIQIFGQDWVRVDNPAELYDYDRFLDMVSYYYNYYAGYLSINWIDSNGTIRWVYPYEPNQSAINRSIEYLLTGNLNYAFYTARTEGKVSFTNVTTLFQGGKGLVTYQPLIYFNSTSSQNQTIGYFNVVFRINEFLENITNKTFVKNDFALKIFEYQQEIFNHSILDINNRYTKTQVIQFYDREWTLYFCPTNEKIINETVLEQFYLIPITFLGALIALLLGRRLYRKSVELEASFIEKHAIEQKLVQAQKIESLGTMAGGLAHDFNNILMGVQANFSLLMDSINNNPSIKEKFSQKELIEWIESQNMIEELFTRAKALTGNILQFSRQTGFEFVPIEINAAIEGIIKIFSTTIDKRIEVIPQIPSEKYYIMGDLSRIHFILTNLLVNSRDALPNGGKIWITLETQIRSKVNLPINQEYIYRKEELKITVRDNGTGIAPENMHKLFDPFFTTKPKGKGTGLGLAIVYNAVKHLNGKIEIQSEKDHWTEINIYFPLIEYKESVQKINEINSIATPQNKHSKVLIIEDEESIRVALQKFFQKSGIDVVGMDNGKKGLEHYQNHLKEYTLVVLDVNLPGLNGIEIYNNMKSLNNLQQFLFITGYSDFQIPDLKEKNVHILSKPFELEELQNTLKDIL